MYSAPNEQEQLERHKGCAGAWRTCPAGQPQEGALHTHPHRHRRASGPSARLRREPFGPRGGGRTHGPANGWPGRTGEAGVPEGGA
eukprot:5885059-Alexandrium_andersonii.AAC.1